MLLLLIAGAAAFVPAAARAATVSETPGILTYATAPREANHVTIVRSGLALQVTDSGTQAGRPIALAAGPGCWKLSATSAACSAPVSSLVTALGDGDDFFDASATGVGASVTCGGGDDTAITTGLDSVATDCELRPPTAPVEAEVPPAAPGPEPTAPAQVVEVSPAGVARVHVVCPAASGDCTGQVAIELPVSRPTIGRSKFAAKAGTSPIVPVRLSKRGRQRILRGRNRRGRLRVTTRTAEAGTVVTTEDVTFTTGPNAKRGRAHR